MGAFALIIFVIVFFVLGHFMIPEGLGAGWFLMVGIILAIMGFNSPGENG
jgi:hypothetical protein